MDTLIRKATPADAVQISLLWFELLSGHLQYDPHFALHSGATDGYASHLQRSADDPSCVLLVAEGENQILGFLYGSLINRPPCFLLPTQGEIWDLFVSAGYRRQGIGARLVSQALEEFSQMQVEFIDVRIASANAPAMAFWKKMGIDPYLTVGKLLV